MAAIGIRVDHESSGPIAFSWIEKANHHVDRAARGNMLTPIRTLCLSIGTFVPPRVTQATDSVAADMSTAVTSLD